MNSNQAINLTKHLAKELFNMEFTAPIKINSRLARALGRYISRKVYLTGKSTPVRLELAARLLTNYNDETIESVIKHELCHWALSVQGKPFDDHHPVFEAELRRVGAHSTGIIQLSGTLYTAICKSCKKVLIRENSQGRLWKYVKPDSRRITNCCRARLEYGKTEFKEDNNVAPIAKVQIAKPVPEVAAYSALQRVAISQPVAAIKSVSATEVTLDLVLEKGPRGVTNKQMIPAIRKVLDMNDRFLLLKLQQAYPEVFQATIRYIGRSYQAQLENMMS